MPLPANGAPWPPRQLANITPVLAEWDAWYVGDPTALQAIYRPNTAGTVRPSQRRPGLVGAVARGLWGTPEPENTDPELQVHVPIASDLAQAAADLLVADPPAITADTPAAQAQVELYEQDGLLRTIAAGAELGGALGGFYPRVTWDRTVQQRVFLVNVDADAVVPSFNLAGQLQAATLWWNVRSYGSDEVWRHLEVHELDGERNGVIFHGLFKGSSRDLGTRMALSADPSTAGLDCNSDGQVNMTATPGLCIEYVPNARPNRAWRSDPLGCYLGRSDYAGAIIPMMDNLDAIYTAWMRDIRLARARAIVPDYMLSMPEAGKGKYFDADRTIYSAMNIPPSPNATIATQMQVIQPAIRFAEHQATAQEWLERILTSAGYSAQTFGENEDGSGVTATEVNSRDRRTALTRGRKIREAQPPLERIIAKMLAMDVALFSQGEAAAVRLVFPAAGKPTQLELANTAKALADAGAASTLTLVKLAQPDLSDEDAQAEADRITSETADSATVDPASFTGADAAGAFPPTEGAAP